MRHLPDVANAIADDGQLLVGGMPVERLAARVGSTPFFAYDRAALVERVASLRRHLPGGVRLHYAVKANPMPAVVHQLCGLVDGFDVASAGEMQLVLNTAVAPEHVGFAGPGKTAAELRQAVAAGITIELESLHQARVVAEVAGQLGVRPRCAIRVNPDFSVKGSGMRMGGGPQPFGVDAEAVPALIRELIALDLDPLGFHVFAGSQNLDADILIGAQKLSVELVVALAEHLPGELRYFNIGGGFGIPYFPKDRPLDLARVGEELGGLLAGSLRPSHPDARVVLELGRYIVGESGMYITRVVDRKVSRGRTYLVVDGGMHHQLAASGNLGQVIRRDYPVAVATRMGHELDQPSTVVGCLCTPLDVLAQEVVLPASDVGDLIVVFQAGAYGLTASPTAFLGHPTPLEVLV